MRLLAWDDNFVTGIDTVDAQHRGLVELINRSATLLSEGGDKAVAEVGTLLNKLVTYAAHHFAHEEELMHQAGLVQVYQDLHRGAHLGFVQEVVSMRSRFEQGDVPQGSDLLRFMVDWLTFHILSEDQRLARQLKARSEGASADEAWIAQRERERGPQAVFMAALLDMFALLTERNHQLDTAQQALQEANRGLEMRVQERTQALASANAALQREQAALQESIATLQKTQQQLLQSEKMAAVGQLAAGVAHEINNPLAFVTGNLGTLDNYTRALLQALDACRAALPVATRKQMDTSPAVQQLGEMREDLPDLLRESRDGLARVTRIVRDLREFAHLDTGAWAEADLNTALESALHLIEGLLGTGVEIRKELGELPKVMCIAPQLTQAFVAVLRNATQALEGTGRLTLRSGSVAETCWVEIEDSGCGMAPDVQRRMFDPFYTTRPVGQGTGLGLSVAWDIVARHDGRIDVHSVPGQGSRIRISMPRAHAGISEQPVRAGD